MRQFISIIFFLVLFFSIDLCIAQSIPSSQDSILETNVKISDLIVEGKVISSRGFKSRKSQIFTSATIRVSKVFKGQISDTLIELVFYGGQYENTVAIVSDGFEISDGEEGIFFLKHNTTFANYRKELLSYEPEGLPISYHDWPYMVAHHMATSQGVTYDDLEKDLFQRIESATGQKRKVFSPNMFETEATKKQQK
jgi:hypothetical protein